MTTVEEKVNQLIDTVAAQGEQIERLTEAIKAYQLYMQWFKTEADRLVKSAGPVLSMAAPMLAQFASGQFPAELLGAAQVPTQPAADTAATIPGGFDRG